MGTEDVILQSLSDAGLTETNDVGEVVGAEEVQETGEEAAPSGSPTETTPQPAEGGEEASGDDLDRELESLGVKGKDARGFETTIRYGRIRRIWDGYKKKHEAEVTKPLRDQMAALDQRFKQAAESAGRLQALERLIQQQPERYFQMLVATAPGLRQFLNPTLFGGGNGNGQTPPPEQDPMPQPDVQYPDGSKAYSMEGLQKRDEWFERRLQARMEKSLEAKYGTPIQRMEQDRRSIQEQQVLANRVRQNVDLATRLYGQVFTDDFGNIGAVKGTSEIMKILQQHPDTPFMVAAAMVCVPKMQANRNAMRDEILKELEARPAAARKSSPGAESTSKEETPSSQEDIILREMRRAHLI